MQEAFAEAEQAALVGEVPVGAVVVHRGTVIARAHNRRELEGDPTAHAEILALREAAEVLGTGRLVFGASDPKAGAVGSLADVPGDERLNHRPEVSRGILAEACGRILKEFFAARRRS